VDTRIKSYTDEKCTNVGFEESVWVIAEVRKKSKLLVGLCYRSPGVGLGRRASPPNSVVTF
jgi:hypothetical protein